MRFVLVLLASLLATSAQAATFSRSTVDGTQRVTLSGPIVEGDYERFLQAVGSTPNVRVVLQSEGGAILAAIKIGDYIRSHGFTTLVANDSLCASACAIIWVAGVHRAVGARAQLGFHAAYDASNGNQVTSVGNALIGAFFARMGLSDRAVAFLTAAAPTDMRWLSLADAQDIGVDVKVLKGPPPSPSATAGPTPSPSVPVTANRPVPAVAGPAQSSASEAVHASETERPSLPVRDVRSGDAGGAAGVDAAPMHGIGASIGDAVRSKVRSAHQ